MTTRIYKVKTETSVRLIKTTSAAAAVRFVAAQLITATRPTQEDLIELTHDGIGVEVVEKMEVAE